MWLWHIHSWGMWSKIILVSSYSSAEVERQERTCSTCGRTQRAKFN